MAEQNVVRQDVVQVKFEVMDSELKAMMKSMTDMTKSITKMSDEMKKSEDEAKKNAKGLQKMANTAQDIKKKLQPAITKIDNGLKKVGKSAISAGKKIASGLGGAAKKVAKGAAVLGTGFASLVGLSVNAYGEYEQLVGGVETLFKDSKDQVVKYANDAYKSAGLSANDYMETVTSFSASLLQSLGGDTKKAAEYANRAIIDMSDNSNKMGTDMESIQYAYNGFAKQNYTMLDNLKLGYGGTKEEMKRLIKDASKMKDVQKELGITVDSSSMSFGNIVNAISVVQKNMGIAGTTSKEASDTIQGSFNAMKSAAQNFITGMADPTQDFDQLIGNLIDSVVTFGKNLIPRIKATIPRLASGIVELAKTIEPYIPPMLQSIGNAIIKYGPIVASKFRDILFQAKDWIIQNKGAIWDGLKTAAAYAISMFGQLFTGQSFNVEGIKSAIQQVADKVLAFANGVKNNWPVIKGTIIGVVGAIGALKVAMGLCNAVIAINTARLKAQKAATLAAKAADKIRNSSLVTNTASMIKNTASLVAQKSIQAALAIKTKAAAAAQWLFNTSILGCPVFWIIAAISALIAIIVVLVKNWDKVKVAGEKCWKAIKSAWSSTAKWFSSTVVEPVKKFFGGLWDTITTKVADVKNSIYDAFKWAYDKVTGAWEGITDFFSGIWKDCVNSVAKPVNKLIDGANWVLDKVGSDKKFDHWQPYAKGTNGHPGGNAIVNDGRGAELVQLPNGKSFIPNGRNVLLPNAPKGMKVLDAQRTASLMGRTSPTFNYAEGTGWIDDIFSFFDNAKGLVGKVIDKFVSYNGLGSYAISVGKGIVSTAKNAMVDWVKGLFDKFGGKSLEGYEPSKGVNQWKSTVANALKMEGLYNDANVKRTLYQMQTESGGNPRAINLWDSNAKKGTPSKGLMQVIDPTFKSYARKGYNSNIYDPMSNILASVRYANARYGSLAKAYRGVGYASGIGFEPRYAPGSTVSSANTTNNSSTNNYNPQFTLNMSGTVDRTTERTVKRWVQEAINETLDSMARRSPRLTEV